MSTKPTSLYTIDEKPIVTSKWKFSQQFAAGILLILGATALVVIGVIGLFVSDEPIFSISWIPVAVYTALSAGNIISIRKIEVYKDVLKIKFWGYTLDTIKKKNIIRWSEKMIHTRHERWLRLRIYTNEKYYSINENQYKNYRKIKYALVQNKNEIEEVTKWPAKQLIIAGGTIVFLIIAYYINEKYWNPVLYKFHGI